LLPGETAVLGYEQCRPRVLDEGVDALRVRGCEGDLEPAPRIGRQALAGGGVEIFPGAAAVAALGEAAARRLVRTVAARAIFVRLAAEIPGAGAQMLGVGRGHRHRG